MPFLYLARKLTGDDHLEFYPQQLLAADIPTSLWPRILEKLRHKSTAFIVLREKSGELVNEGSGRAYTV
jgi:hypothetical protein